MKTLQITLLLLCISFIISAQDDAFKSYEVVYSQSFSKEKCINDFDFSDPSKWLISKNGEAGKALKCLGTGKYKSQHDGPAIVAVLKGYELKDFILELDVTQNGRDYSLLDFCIFFGIKDTTHYCYAQLASKADKKSHNLFKVAAAKPKRMGPSLDKGVIWGMKKWQHIRLERTSNDKKVRVFFNDTLVYEISDETFDSGHIGFGSSNSAIKVDNFKLSAPSYQNNEKTFF